MEKETMIDDINISVLFRQNFENEQEYNICSRLFPTFTQRSNCESEIVIGRYSVLPYYKELEIDLKAKNSRLINSYKQHRWIANFDYYDLVKPYTFQTWFNLADIPEGQFVVKGRTNSRKARWNTQMFAKDRRTAIDIASELMMDPLLQEQGIIVRKYEPLELIEEGLNGQPFVNEHRIFYVREERIAHGFYWVQTENKAEIDQAGLDFADSIAKLVAKNVNFFVLDVAKNQKGEWRLVEINDGQMSGLSNIDPKEFYTNLRQGLFISLLKSLETLVK